MTNFLTHIRVSHPRHRPFTACLQCAVRSSLPVSSHSKKQNPRVFSPGVLLISQCSVQLHNSPMDPGIFPSGVRSYDRLLIANQEEGIKPACLAIEQCCLIYVTLFILLSNLPLSFIHCIIAAYVLIIHLFSLVVNHY